MKSFAINGTRRETISKQNVRQLRKDGSVVCVLYGGKEPIHFSAPALAVKNLVYSPEVYTVDLTIDGATHKAVMRDLQFHPINDRLLHLDFQEIIDDKPVTVQIPVVLTGSAVGVRAGGTLHKKMRMLAVKALPSKLPENVTIKIDDMNIGDSVHVRDMKVEGVEFLDLQNKIIVAVKVTRVVVEEAPVAAATTEGAAAPAEGAAPAAGAAAPAAGAAPGAAPAKGAAAAGKEAAPAKGGEKKK